jgi:hypothetical protein
MKNTPLISTTGIMAIALGFFLLSSIQAAEKKEAPLETAAGIPLAKIKESIISCPLEDIKLDGWASIDVGGEIVEWDWDINGDRKPDTVVYQSGELEIMAPREACSFAIYLWVKDNKGNKSEPDSCTVHVQASTPRVSMGPDTTVPITVRVNLDPQIETFCSKPVRFEWDFNDDGKPEYHSEETGKTSRVYFKPGKYYARFKVIDNLGKEAGGIKTINVVGKRS